ncbi:hypothetical protein SAMN04490243_2817 [Robiginitalea myxolifaciens]|uniref:DUF3052 domain-containing protein n=1 Tax=Robiginitalea myxolifaciens TaxID=400055 RepID=A0A1I6HJE6_9FLAO|nr:hypothetical protein [Robiginitalea myxolifaciens]SFR54581.1 hypothetical protein SAMN04490243_2817 [Robiginitalea myxolifaciens]
MSATNKASSGYSGTPLHRKLGIKEGMKLLVIEGPIPYRDFFNEWPKVNDLVELATLQSIESRELDAGTFDFIHLFASTFESLERGLAVAHSMMTQKGMVWVSWPKKASGLNSEIGKFDVMQTGLSMGLVDVKVASIDETWSGHKFVIPVKDRT